MEELAGSSQYTREQKQSKIEGSIIADIVDHDLDAVLSRVWVDEHDGILAIAEFDQFDGLADGDSLFVHLNYNPELATTRWEVTVYVSPSDKASCEHAKAFTKLSGMHAKSVLYDVLGLIKSTVAAVQ
jgi:hypothetical protein